MKRLIHHDLLGLVQGIQNNSQYNERIDRMKRKTTYEHLDKCRKSTSQNPVSVPDLKKKKFPSEPVEENALTQRGASVEIAAAHSVPGIRTRCPIQQCAEVLAGTVRGEE